MLNLKKIFISIAGIFICIAVIRAIKETDFRSSSFSISRQIQYSFTLSNRTNRLIKEATFFACAPVKQTCFQHCSHIKSNYPFRLISDKSGNRILEFTFNNLSPYAKKIIQIKADLLLSGKPVHAPVMDIKPYLKKEKYIESDNSAIFKTAQKLDTANKPKTAKNIFQWVADNVQYRGYIKRNRGALYALSHKKGDCTEFMYLFAALCRAVKIPSRCMGGYIIKKSSIIKPGDYHNWAEFYEDGAWRIADPLNRMFMKEESNYIAMRVIEQNPDNQISGFNRFRVRGEGLEAKMN